jgi:hypothetical protein
MQGAGPPIRVCDDSTVVALRGEPAWIRLKEQMAGE